MEVNKPIFDTEKTDTNVLKVNLVADSRDWEQWFLLRSDAHHDNVNCRRDIEMRHLEEAKKKGAGIIDIGDLFCAMQGKYDKRSDKSKLRPEHQTSDYLDALVRTTTQDYAPYANNWLVMGYGNHETSIADRYETDLTQRLVSALNDRTGSNIQALGYTGWVSFNFTRRKTARSSIKLWFTHGYGGGGPVTEDMIQSSRQRVFIENADIMISGHVHRSWTQEYIKQKVTLKGKIERRLGTYVKLPTYKDAYKNGIGGFEVSKGMGPRPLGAYWLRFFLEAGKVGYQVIKAN